MGRMESVQQLDRARFVYSLFLPIHPITVRFAVFPFQYVTLMRIPRTCRQDAKNNLYICHLTALCSTNNSVISKAIYSTM